MAAVRVTDAGGMPMRRLSRGGCAALLALGSLGGAVGILAAERARVTENAPDSSNKASTDFTLAPPACASVPAPSIPPVPVHRDPVLVSLARSGEHAERAMQETPPLISPDVEARPVTIALHSLCYDPRWTCDWFRPGDFEPQWQLCPRGPLACGGGGYRWGWNPKNVEDLLRRSLAALRESAPARVLEGKTVLVGYSDGGYAVASLVHVLAQGVEPPFALAGVVIFAANVDLVAAELRRLGVRVGFAAGDFDGAAATMKARADALRREGVDTRFVSLGRVGHVIPQETSGAIGALIDWARGD